MEVIGPSLAEAVLEALDLGVELGPLEELGDDEGLGLPQAWIALDARTSALTLCASRPVARLDAATLDDFLQAYLDCMNGLGRRIRPGLAAVEVKGDDLADLFVLRI